jgi:restriction endonuclease S subunit
MQIFDVTRSSLQRRWDPHFHRPVFVEMGRKLDALGARSLRTYTRAIFSGITPLSGGDSYTEKNEGVAFIRSGDFNEDGTINETDLIYLKPDVHGGLMQRSQLKANDVLFAIVGATIGKVGLFPGGYPANINQAVGTVRVPHETFAKFLHAFFMSPLGQQQIDRIKRPVARANLNLAELGSLRVPPVSEAVQIAVVGRLKRGIAAKTLTEARASQLLASIDDLLLEELGIKLAQVPPAPLADRVFRRSFSKLSGNRWDPLFFQRDIYDFIRHPKLKLRPLSDFIVKMTTGFAAGKDDQADDDNGVVQIRPTNFSDDRELIFERNVYIDRRELAKHPVDILQRREVLFNNTNSQELVGKSVLFDLPGEFFASNHITRVTLREKELHPEFLTHVLNLYQRKRVFFRLCTNWNNQSGVGPEVLRKVLIPEISEPEQRRIVTKISTLRASAKSLRAEAIAHLAAAKLEIEMMILGTKAS